MDTSNVVVGAVAVRDGRVLLLQRSQHERFLPGVWGIPAGKACHGEPLEDAVLRELEEEAGLKGTLGTFAGSTWFLSRKDGRPLQNVQVNFLVNCDHGTVRLDRSSAAHRWIDATELADLDRADVEIDDFTRDILLKAMQVLQTQPSAFV